VSEQMSAPDLATIQRIVAARVGGKRSIAKDTPLISGGLIDSMSIVELILELEATFSIKIPASEVQPDDFDTVGRIAETVARFR
jgi:acyl carrier protein